VPDISWQPDDRKPADAAEIEAEIDRITRGGTVRLTLVESGAETGWRVRALLAAAMCARGASASDRDVSDKVAEVLIDHGVSVTARG
jgi:hypothetical protein